VQDELRGQPDKPAKTDSAPKPPGGGAKEWNARSVTHAEQPLSAAERAERARVASPQGGVGCGFDRVPTGEAVKDWYNGLSKEQKAALQDPRTVVTLTPTASLTGSRPYNVDLTQRRGEAFKQTLQDLGVKAKIVIEARDFEPAEDRGAAKGKDNHQDRVVYADINKADKTAPAGVKQQQDKAAAPTGEKPAGKDVQPPKDITEPPCLPKEFNFDRKLSDFLKNGKVDENTLITKMLQAAKKMFEATHELHAANVAASRLLGTFYALNIVGRDGRVANNPHVKDGKPYTAGELADRLSGPYGADLATKRTQCQVYNKDAPKDVDRGIAAVAEAANKVLAGCRDAAERQAALDKFATATQRVIGDNRQKRMDELRERKARR